MPHDPATEDVATGRPGDRLIGPAEMAKQLVEALGLTGVKGIMKLQISCEGGKVPTLTVVRTITQEQAGAVRLCLLEWDCELVPRGEPCERRIKADGSVDEASALPSRSSHRPEG